MSDFNSFDAPLMGLLSQGKSKSTIDIALEMASDAQDIQRESQKVIEQFIAKAGQTTFVDQPENQMQITVCGFSRLTLNLDTGFLKQIHYWDVVLQKWLSVEFEESEYRSPLAVMPGLNDDLYDFILSECRYAFIASVVQSVLSENGLNTPNAIIKDWFDLEPSKPSRFGTGTNQLYSHLKSITKGYGHFKEAGEKWLDDQQLLTPLLAFKSAATITFPDAAIARDAHDELNKIRDFKCNITNALMGVFLNHVSSYLAYRASCNAKLESAPLKDQLANSGQITLIGMFHNEIVVTLHLDFSTPISEQKKLFRYEVVGEGRKEIPISESEILALNCLPKPIRESSIDSIFDSVIHLFWEADIKPDVTTAYKLHGEVDIIFDAVGADAAKKHKYLFEAVDRAISPLHIFPEALSKDELKSFVRSLWRFGVKQCGSMSERKAANSIQPYIYLILGVREKIEPDIYTPIHGIKSFTKANMKRFSEIREEHSELLLGAEMPLEELMNACRVLNEEIDSIHALSY